MSPPRFAFATLFAVLVLSGCRCGTNLNQRSPEISVDVASVDFGRVELNQLHRLPVFITNRGTVTLTVSELRLEAPFGTEAELPLSIGPDDTAEVILTFAPSRPDVREEGTLMVINDDPGQFELPIPLSGTGIAGVARAMPTSLDFGDVYVGDTKTLTVTITNLGSAPLRTQTVTGPSSDGFSADVSMLTERIPGAASATGTVTFVPPAMGEASGVLSVVFPPDQGGELTVPVRGRGVQAIPQLCVETLVDGVEVCTPVTATSSNGQGNILVTLPPRCDIGLFPPDAGAGACDEESATAGARLRVKNAGNVPFEYTLSYDRALSPNPCGLPTAPQSDFRFANAPLFTDGGSPRTWSEATTSLPLMPSAPPPYETAPVALTYRATSTCEDDTSDQARVLLTRVGMMGREPRILTAILQGSSRLPKLQGSNWNCTAMGGPCASTLRGVLNYGPAPAEVTGVEIVQVRSSDSATFLCNAKLDAGSVEPCAFDGSDAPGDNCAHFRWTLDGGTPVLPAFVDGGAPGMPAAGAVGTLEFAHDGFGCSTSGGVCTNVTYCLYGILETTDPYNPEVVIELRGTAQ